MVKKARKICIVTGSRAEYGLLKPIIKLIDNSSKLTLQLVVTGMHLSKEYGFTLNEVVKDKFHINKRLETLMSSDTAVGISKSVGLGIISFAEALEDLNPDFVLILGDRYEILSIAIASLLAQIPIAHISGGEVTQGAFDESIRHSITKMSSVHFVAADEYKRRVIQLGEDKTRVFNVGGLGVDAIKKTNFLSIKALEEKINFKFKQKNLLITFHPETLDKKSSLIQLENLLSALDKFDNTGLIFTMPNADSESKKIDERIKNFCLDRKNTIYIRSLGQEKYYSCLNIIDGLVGNSSSGICEAPTFNIGTVNIGERQKGRLRCKSIVDVDAETKNIEKAIELILSEEFKNQIKDVINPYQNNNTARNILNILTDLNLSNITKKKFFDI